MATGGSEQFASDELIDHLCSACKNKSISTIARVYCTDCKDYYCNKCVDVHKTFPALRDHVILSADDSHGGKLPSLPTSRCDRHAKNIIDMYCEEHDEVGCTKCIIIEHSGKCKKLFDIPEFVQSNKTIVPNFIETVENIETELKSRLNIFHQEQTGLQQNKEGVIDNIKTARDRLISTIRKQTEEAIQTVNQKYHKVNDELKAKITKLNKEIDKLDKLLKEMKLVSNNVPQVFVLSKSTKCKNVVSKAKELNNDMKDVNLGKRLAFDLNNLYEQIQRCETSDLGTVSVTTPRLYSFSKIRKINCDIESVIDIFIDRYFDFHDSCCTSDGSVFFTKSDNNSLYRICYKTLNIVEKLDMHRPRGVCCVSNTTIAVRQDTTIQMIDITGKLKLTNSINVDVRGRGLHYYDDTFYVTSKDSVYKYDRNGKLLKSYCKCPDGNNIFSKIYNVVVNPVNQHIHITDFENGVITMNQDGHVLNIVKGNISRPYGICVDQYGQVFVSGLFSNNIIQLDSDGRYITTVISERLYVPMGICFDTSRGIFYVGDLGNNVNIYKVENEKK